jgi:hypothetical protein
LAIAVPATYSVISVHYNFVAKIIASSQPVYSDNRERHRHLFSLLCVS